MTSSSQHFCVNFISSADGRELLLNKVTETLEKAGFRIVLVKMPAFRPLPEPNGACKLEVIFTFVEDPFFKIGDELSVYRGFQCFHALTHDEHCALEAEVQNAEEDK